MALCTDCRQLLQTEQQPASLASAPNAALSAPSTALTAAQQDAAGPFASTGPLPAGVVSRAMKKAKENSNHSALLCNRPNSSSGLSGADPSGPWGLFAGLGERRLAQAMLLSRLRAYMGVGCV